MANTERKEENLGEYVIHFSQFLQSKKRPTIGELESLQREVQAVVARFYCGRATTRVRGCLAHTGRDVE